MSTLLGWLKDIEAILAAAEIKVWGYVIIGCDEVRAIAVDRIDELSE
jgi:hypothetical protein